MEIAATKLEALMNQANTILDTVAYQLDTKLSKGIEMQTSVVKVVQMVQDMSNDLEKKKQESEMIAKEQEVVKEKIVSLLPEITKKLHYLEGHTGANDSNNNKACSNLINKFDNLNV